MIPQTKDITQDHELLKEGIFKDSHPFFKGLVVKCEKMGVEYMVTINEGQTWTNLYARKEAAMKVFDNMTKDKEKEENVSHAE